MDEKLRTFVFLILLAFDGEITVSNASPLMGEKVKQAEENEFPFVVSLSRFGASELRERYHKHFCGGSLITRRHVLTAAHCIVGEDLPYVIVTVGSINLNEGKLYTVKSRITYDEWMKKKNNVPEFSSNDIAVVTLSKDVDHIVPAVRSSLPDAEIFGKEVLTVGWGLLADNTLPQFLQTASIRVLSPKKCRHNTLKLFGTEDFVPHNHYCTSAKPLITLGCGDSGGPLLLKDTNEIVGVNEATCEVKNATAQRYATNIHVKVNYFKEFIDDVSKE